MAYSFEFPIKHLYPDHDAGIPVAVFITYGGKTEKVSAKLDTGADFCVFTHDVAMQLGVPLDTGLKKTFDTSGGLVDTYGHEVTIHNIIRSPLKKRWRLSTT